MKKIFAIILMTAALAACTDVNQVEPIEEPDAPKTYTLTINATKGEDIATKALSIGRNAADTKNVLNATWGENDEVSVYNKTKGVALTGKLKANEPGSAGATLTGELTGTIQKDDVIYLLFPNTTASFEGQDGTLSTIATNYDYCYGKAKVTAVNGNNISAVDYTTESAPVNFTNCQAIVKFTLLNKANDEPINATSLTISAKTATVNTLIKSLDLTTDSPVPVFGDLTINPSPAANEIYAALSGINGSDITLTASDGTDTYTFEKSNVTFTNGKYYEITVKMTKQAPAGKTIDLSTVTVATTAENGDVLTGTLGERVKISIAADATVTLDGVTISGANDSGSPWAGLTCEGNAIIILKDGTENTVKGFYCNYPGIQAAHNTTGSGEEYTLTIRGTGKLTAKSGGDNNNNSYGAGIGGGIGIDCGNIVIEGGEITAIGGYNATGIGTGSSNNNYPSTCCGNITITGGTVTATGGTNAAGIGSSTGYNKTTPNICGNIRIEGGTVTATGGTNAAGIGSGSGFNNYDSSTCGGIIITNDVAKVVATKGSTGGNSIGVGYVNRGSSTCGTVTIDGVENATTSSEFTHFTSAVSGNTWTLTNKN